MSIRGEVLVAIINDRRDFAIARDQNWYRVPVSSVEKWLKERWPPQWLAFYQTKVFGEEAYSVSYYTQVIHIRKADRWQLFPNEPLNEKSNRQYYQLILNPLQRLPQPILSRRWRIIVFIPTTWQKFINAVEINDLYDESSLEDRLWAEFKRYNIPAERQEFITIKQQYYALDFAIYEAVRKLQFQKLISHFALKKGLISHETSHIESKIRPHAGAIPHFGRNVLSFWTPSYCAKGSIDIETDGDSWHTNPEKAGEDNRRDNALEAVGWNVLRFTTHQIQEQAEEF